MPTFTLPLVRAVGAVSLAVTHPVFVDAHARVDAAAVYRVVATHCGRTSVHQPISEQRAHGTLITATTVNVSKILLRMYVNVQLCTVTTSYTLTAAHFILGITTVVVPVTKPIAVDAMMSGVALDHWPFTCKSCAGSGSDGCAGGRGWWFVL